MVVYSVQWFSSDSLLWGAVLKRRGLPQSSLPASPLPTRYFRFKQKLGDCGPQAPGGLLIPFQLDNNLSGRWPPRGCKPPSKRLGGEVRQLIKDEDLISLAKSTWLIEKIQPECRHRSRREHFFTFFFSALWCRGVLLPGEEKCQG